MNRLKTASVFLTVSLLFFVNIAFSDDVKDVETYIKTNLDKVFTLLSSDTINSEEKTAQVIGVVSPMFDFELITKLSFGRKHWTAMTEAQQKTFVDLFIKLVKASIIEKLSLYTNEKVQVSHAEVVKNKAKVPTTLFSKDSKFSINYKLYKSGNSGWKIYDLEIEDVSVVKSYQAQIDEILQKGTYEDLLSKLKKT